MSEKKAGLVRAADIRAQRRAFMQRLNPDSRFEGSGLGRRCGLERTGVSIAWLAPGKQSFAYHAHRTEEEWIYILSGRGVCEVAEGDVELGPGDFMGFPAPGVPHLLKNPFDEELVYLMGGENRGGDIIDYPKLGKSYLLQRHEGKTGFFELRDPIFPFGPAE